MTDSLLSKILLIVWLVQLVWLVPMWRQLDDNLTSSSAYDLPTYLPTYITNL